MVRHSHGVKLTDKGRAFLEAISPVLAQLDDIDRRFKGHQNRKGPQSLAIGGSHSICVRVLPNLLKAFREKHPSVEFTLAANDSSVIEKHLLKSELDLGVITNPSHTEGLIYKPFGRMKVVAVCLPRNPVAGKTLSLKELAEHPLLVKSPGRIESVLTSRGYKMNFTLRCEVSQAIKAAVRRGLGIGILYQNEVETPLAKGSLKLVNVPELRQMEIKSFIAYDGRKPLSSIALEFVALLRERKKMGCDNRRPNDDRLHAKRARTEIEQTPGSH